MKQSTSWALVTGASKGIGREIAVQLAQRGYHLVLVARTAALLEALAAELRARYPQQEALVCAVDLTRPGIGEEVRTWLDERGIAPQVLVNNAGFGVWGWFTKESREVQQNMLTLNMDAMVDLTHALLPLLRKHPQSWVMNVGSTGAYQAVPAFTLYAASKAFVLAFSRGLRWELRGTGVHVCCLNPGATESEFVHRARMHALESVAKKVQMKAADVARIGLNGMFRGKSEIVPGFVNKLNALAARWLPKNWVEKAAASIYMKRTEGKP